MDHKVVPPSNRAGDAIAGNQPASINRDSRKPVRVLVAEDQPDFRAALEELISDEPSLELAGSAEDADEAIEIARKERPDLALLDVNMPGGGGLRAAREIRVNSPETRLLTLSATWEREAVFGMIRAGAVGYVLKDLAPQELVKAITRVSRGEAILSRRVTFDVIAELASLLNRAEALNAELEVFDRTRIELIQILSHELLTPLTVIQGAVIALSQQGPGLSPENKNEARASADRAIARLKRIAGNVSAVARLDRDNIQIPCISISVDDLLSRIAREFRSSHDTLRLPAAGPKEYLWANPELATRAIGLVIENALQLSPQGEVVEIAIERTSQSVEIQVSDRGPGVADELRERIFEPFAQADGSTTRTHPGIGMGLYLARRIMDAHGGAIRILPRTGGGSTFVLVFAPAPHPHEVKTQKF